YAVGVDVTAHPLVVAVNNVVMLPFVYETYVGAVFVRVERGIVVNGGSEEAVNRLLGRALVYLETHLTASRHRAKHHGLTRSPVALTHALLFAAYPCLVGFNNTRKQRRLSVLHRCPDTVAQIPRCLIGNANCPLHLVGADALARLNHEQNSSEPLSER